MIVMWRSAVPDRDAYDYGVQQVDHEGEIRRQFGGIRNLGLNSIEGNR